LQDAAEQVVDGQSGDSGPAEVGQRARERL